MNDRESAKGDRLLLLPRYCAVVLIRFYQIFISPLKKFFLGPYGCCRFHPTCSEYARQSLIEHGFWRGGFLSLCRLLRCHPFHPGGLDPVPRKEINKGCCSSCGDDAHFDQKTDRVAAL